MLHKAFLPFIYEGIHEFLRRSQYKHVPKNACILSYAYFFLTFLILSLKPQKGRELLHDHTNEQQRISDLFRNAIFSNTNHEL